MQSPVNYPTKNANFIIHAIFLSKFLTPSCLIKHTVRFSDLLFLVLDKKRLLSQNVCLAALQVTVPSGDPIRFYLLLCAFIEGITKAMIVV